MNQDADADAMKAGRVYSRFKDALINTGLVIGSLLATYAVLEFIFFRWLLPAVPLSWWAFTPNGPDFFLLNAGREYQSPGYIALLGDSYAVGLGDWLQANRYRKGRPYHSAHVLRELMGVNIVDFGRPAIGSPEAMVQRPTRIFDADRCLSLPRVAPPGQFLIYFYEGNDLDDNYITLAEKIGPSQTDVRAQIDRFLEDVYAKRSPWRCHGYLGDFTYRMARFLRDSRGVIEAANKRLALRNSVVIDNVPHLAPPLQVPSMTLSDAQFEEAAAVFDRSLAWLRQNFPDIPSTVVYVPAPSSVYRFASAEIASTDVLDPATVGINRAEGPLFSAAAVYANSQRICRRIRDASVAANTGFIDVRAALRKHAAKALLHGPNDWTHFNETGYRALAAAVAERLTPAAKDDCVERW